MRAWAVAAGLALAAPAFGHGDPGHGGAARAAAADEFAFGRPGDPRQARRTVRIAMDDRMRFTPDHVRVAQGETVRFVVRNGGKVVHEFVIGTMPDLKAHAELMRKYPSMEHDDPYGVHVAPGNSGVVVWQFTNAGEYHFGCLVPGHFESGMVGRITVERKGEAK